jgi:hypothetical protein
MMRINTFASVETNDESDDRLPMNALAGTWSEADLAEFEAVTREFSEVEEEQWRTPSARGGVPACA